MKAEIRRVFARFGRQGGKKAAQNSTPEERSARARKAGLARQQKAREAREVKDAR